MANWYVWSGAAGSGTGADWTNAYIRLRLAMAAKAAGDVFFVAHDHAETEAAAMTIASAGTELLPCRIYCVNRAGSVPPVSADLRTTATITTTGAFGITTSGSVSECYGIIFNCGTGSTTVALNIQSNSARTWRLVNCALRSLTTHAASHIRVGSSNGAIVVLENTTVQFSNISQMLQAFGIFVWRNTPSAITGATLPTNLLNAGASLANFYLEGVDLSALASGKTLASISTTTQTKMLFKDCKLGATVAICNLPTGTGTLNYEVNLIRCDSGDTNYRTEKHTSLASQTVETTIVRSGGATDGTTPIAWKIVTTVNAIVAGFAFESLPISIWNETTGSAVTVTVQGIWGGGAVPLNDEIWIDVEYLGTSGFPLASRATSGKADGLATGASIPAGAGTWGGSTTKFAMSATFTPQEKGPITIYVRVAKVSSTFYIDPKPVIT